MSTAGCLKVIKAVDLTPFEKLIKGNKTSWKRVSKFLYRDNVRRYFYLLESCLIATVDDVAGELKVVVRPPMQWELYMIQDARPQDKYLAEKCSELWEKHYNFVTAEAAKGSEPQQYTFEVGPEDGGWIFFSPIKCDEYDEHLSGDLDLILPEWLVKSGEVMECIYVINNHPLWRIGQLDDALKSIKQELSELGFTEQVNNYAKCI